MENLRMKFELNGLKFEIEGVESVVREEFREFKEFTQQLVAKVNLSNMRSADETQSPMLSLDAVAETDVSSEFPLIKDVVMQDMPQSEFEWVLIYAFYESKFGQQAFTRESLLAKYRDTGRYNENRSKKFAENFKSLITKKLVKSKNDTEYILLSDGRNKAVEILNGESKNTSYKKLNNSKSLKNEVKEKRSPSKSNGDFKILKDLNLRPDDKDSLREFASKFEITGIEELYLVIVYYLRGVLEVEHVTLSHIVTCLIELDRKVPTHLKQIFVNLRNSNSSNHWLQLDDLESIDYSIRGMNHIKHDIRKVNG